MDPVILQKLLTTLGVLGIITLLVNLLKLSAQKTRLKFSIRKSRYFILRRILNTFYFVLSAAALLIIWDISLQNVWVSVTSILAVTAIAFFAIWSLVGNVLAGVILYFTSPFRIDDTIEIMPDEIRGTVLAINTFYTVLLDEDNSHINVPNTLFFQKYIKVTKRWTEHPLDQTQPDNED